MTSSNFSDLSHSAHGGVSRHLPKLSRSIQKAARCSSQTSKPSWLDSSRRGTQSTDDDSGTGSTALTSQMTLGQLAARYRRSAPTNFRLDPPSPTQSSDVVAETHPGTPTDIGAANPSPVSPRIIATPSTTTPDEVSAGSGSSKNNITQNLGSGALTESFLTHVDRYHAKQTENNGVLSKAAVLSEVGSSRVPGPCGTLDYQSKLWDTVSGWAHTIKQNANKFRINGGEEVDVSGIDESVFTAASFHMALGNATHQSGQSNDYAGTIQEYGAEKNGIVTTVAEGAGFRLTAKGVAI